MLRLHEEAQRRGVKNSVATCTLAVELNFTELYLSPGSEKNIKVTTTEDIEILKALMHTKKDSWLK